jgi:hypothetical protein
MRTSSYFWFLTKSFFVVCNYYSDLPSLYAFLITCLNVSIICCFLWILFSMSYFEYDMNLFEFSYLVRSLQKVTILMSKYYSKTYFLSIRSKKFSQHQPLIGSWKYILKLGACSWKFQLFLRQYFKVRHLNL